MFPVGEKVMGFENLIRFTVSYERSKAGTERTDKPHLSLLQILYPKTRLLAHVTRWKTYRRKFKNRLAQWLDDF